MHKFPMWVPGAKLGREIANSNFSEEVNLSFVWTITKVLIIVATFKTFWLFKWIANGFKYERDFVFYPKKPRVWYDIHYVCCLLNLRPVSGNAGELLMVFEDKTQLTFNPAEEIPKPYVALNYNCTDITKSNVAKNFAEVFGYPLAVKPLTHEGEMVEKAEDNGKHNGQIVQGPLSQTKPEHTYQRLIDNRTDEHTVQDIRAIICGPEIVHVYIKDRSIGERFANHNIRVRLHKTEDFLSEEEQLQVLELCAKMGLDYGGVDVLRDRESGKIYVVDINKTTMGLPIDLPYFQKIRATRAICRAFKNHFLRSDNVLTFAPNNLLEAA